MIKLVDINKSYQNQQVLKNINLEIHASEFVVLLGKSGSGKSTLLNILGLIDRPSSGEYYFQNELINTLNPARASEFRAKNFGFIFQRYNLISQLSVQENILLAANYAQTSNAKDYCENLLQKLDISAIKDQFAANLSGGQQQRVSVARALINNANFILADEPTGALDSANAAALMQLLLEANKRGVGVIMVTHDESMCSYASRIIRLKDGQIISDERQKADSRISFLQDSPTKAQNHSNDQITKQRQLFSPFARLGILCKESLKNLCAHKLRSLLTMLGIIIASAAIICTIALGNGASASVLEEISFLGNNTIIVQKGRELGDAQTAGLKDLNPSDITLLKSLPQVADVGVVSSLGMAKISSESKELIVDAQGVLSNYLRIKNKKLLAGRFFAEFENERAKNIVVLSQSAAKSLFKQAHLAVGKNVLINSKPLKVIGVLAKDRQDSEGFDVRAFMPAQTMAANFSGDYKINRLYVLVRQNAASKQTEALIKRVLELKKGANSIVTYNLDAIRKTIESTAAKLSALIFGVAMLAMIVGGIGVMNIMLVAIKERTKEIGIKLAIGASPRAIGLGFLIEALIMSLIGAFIGASIATVLSLGLNHLNIRMILSLDAYLLGIGLSAMCGLVFGYFPARRASQLMPSECLSEL